MNLAQTLLLASLTLSPQSRTIDEWVDAFREVGYFSFSGDPSWIAPELPERIKLFRGAEPGSERGLWWTPRATYAQMFGDLYSAEFPREAILASHWDPRAREMEYLIDPAGSEVRVCSGTRTRYEG